MCHTADQITWVAKQLGFKDFQCQRENECNEESCLLCADLGFTHEEIITITNYLQGQRQIVRFDDIAVQANSVDYTPGVSAF
ncbi:MAG: hypothetical protein ABII21_00580 [bacterium]